MSGGLIGFFKGATKTPVAVDDQTNPLPVTPISGATPLIVQADGKATAAAPVYGEGSLDPLSMDLAGNLRVRDKLMTPAAATASTVAVAGTAVTFIIGPINGGYVTNPANAARQGIVTAEPGYIDLVGTPGSTEAAANGTTSALDPGQTFALPPLEAGVTVKVNAATAGHKFSVEVW